VLADTGHHGAQHAHGGGFVLRVKYPRGAAVHDGIHLKPSEAAAQPHVVADGPGRAPSARLGRGACAYRGPPRRGARGGLPRAREPEAASAPRHPAERHPPQPLLQSLAPLIAPNAHRAPPARRPTRPFTLAMVDPDAPSPDHPKARCWLHWLVSDCRPGEDAGAGGNGRVLCPYSGPTPPKGT
jgi:hypothetical protein